MTDTDDRGRKDTLAKLAQSRAEFLSILEPPRRDAPAGSGPDDGSAAGHAGAFPRSRTMKLLLSGRGIGTLGAVLGGLALARPALVLRLIRMLPAGALARILLVKAVTALRSNAGKRLNTPKQTKKA